MPGMEAAIASGIISGILKVAANKLVSLLASEFAAITGVKKHLLELQDIHGEIESLLTTTCDLSIQNDPRFHWVIRLKDVAYDVDELLFEAHLEAEKHMIARASGMHGIADTLSAKPKSYLYRYKIAKQIKRIQATLAAIAKQRSYMNAIGHNIQQLSQPIILSRNIAKVELSLLTNVEESKIPRRDQEKAAIITELLESNEGEHNWIVSIVGLGGSGKTTLAQHICHDNKIKEQFKGKIYWVHVSQDLFNEKNLICKLFEAITKEKSDPRIPQYMVDEISRKLTSEKFLVILDDAWHQDKEDWKRFLVHFKGRALESKLLLTTRDRKVAEALNPKNIFRLEYLSKDESWMYFLKNSGLKEEDLGTEFIQFGKDIVNKCGGVPLAIKTLGGILNEKMEVTRWRAIKQSNLWNVENVEDRVFASLKLSYIHLKDHLKECFLFCSIFPKGYRMQKNYLIEQWIASGLIKQMTVDEQQEVVGIEYFDLLVKIGFLEEISNKSVASSEIACKMHDLMHDLTQYILQGEMAVSPTENMTKDCTQKCRYLSLTSSDKKFEKLPFYKVRALCALDVNPSSLDKLVKKNPYICSVVLKCAARTLFPLFILKLDYLGYLEIYNVFCTKLPNGISDCWNLQSLHFIKCSGFAALPESIGKLKKLRNLELTRTDLKSLPQSIGDCQALQSLHIEDCEEFKEIPNSIGKSQNLRVLEIVHCSEFEQLPSEVTLISRLECLNLERCYHLVELPRGIGNLKRLRFLNLDSVWRLHWMPSGIAQLTCLERLDLFVVGRGAEEAKISGLENLNMISGRLELKNLPHLLDYNDAKKACLMKKKNLQNLCLRWSTSAMEEELVSDLGAADALEPPSQIITLEIWNFRGTHLPCWMSTKSGSSYLNNAMLNQTSQLGFICLISLKLFNMPNLKHMRGILVLPSLRYLYLIDMPILEELWTTTRSGLGTGEEEVAEQQCFPILRELWIVNCPKLTVEPYFPPSLESMSLERCKVELLSRDPSSFPLVAPISHHPYVDGPSICSGAFVMTPHLKELALRQIVMSVSDWGFLQQLTRLEYLLFDECYEGLTELPESIRGLTTLKFLCINKCSSLIALPEWLGELTSLQRIGMYDCPMIDNLPRSIVYLTSLTSLGFSNRKNLKQLPDEIQHLSSLRALDLSGCQALTELPEGIGKLSALQILYIHNCPALQSLPSSIQHLTSLRRLHIWGSPELVRRYEKGVGDDWHLVSHILIVDTKGPTASYS